MASCVPNTASVLRQHGRRRRQRFATFRSISCPVSERSHSVRIPSAAAPTMQRGLNISHRCTAPAMHTYSGGERIRAAAHRHSGSSGGADMNRVRRVCPERAATGPPAPRPPPASVIGQRPSVSTVPNHRPAAPARRGHAPRAADRRRHTNGAPSAACAP